MFNSRPSSQNKRHKFSQQQEQLTAQKYNNTVSSNSTQKSSKNRHLQAINNLSQNKLKEESWDNRFVYAKFQPYNHESKRMYKAPPSAGKEQQRQALIQPGGRIKKSTRPPSSSTLRGQQIRKENLVDKYYQKGDRPQTGQNNQRQINPRQLEEQLREEQIIINQVWEEYNIPHFHRQLYVDSNKLLPRKQLIQNIQKEIQTLKQKRSTIQNCIRAIKAREACLQQLYQKSQEIPQISEDQEQLQIHIEKCSELIIHQRILSLNVLESILRWRQFLNQSYHQSMVSQQRLNPEYFSNHLIQSNNQQQYMPFIHNHQNYIIKMSQDTLDLKSTELANYMCFSESCDPFFLSAQKAKMSEHNKITILHEIKQTVIQRIRASELIILEEIMYKKLEEQNQVLEVQPLECYEDEVEQIIGKYIDLLDKSNKQAKESFISDPEVLTQSTSIEQDCNWFQLINQDTQEIQGIAQIHIDKNCFSCRRMIILHISTLKKEQFQKFLNYIVDYIWKNDSCEEIRIALQHIQLNENDKLGVDKQIQDYLKQLGFKWKSLVNEKDTGKRTTVLGVKRSLEQQTNNLNNSQQIAQQQQQTKKLQQEPILLDCAYIISEQGNSSSQSQDGLIIDYDQNSLLAECLNIYNLSEEKLKLFQEKQEDVPKFKHIMDLLNLYQQKRIKVPGCISKIIENQNDLNEETNKLFKDQNFILENSKQKVSLAIQSLVYRWQSFNMVDIIENNTLVQYLRLNPVEDDSLNISRSDLIQNQIHLISTDDENVSGFAFNLEENELQEILEGNLYSFVSKIIKNCESKQSSQQQLWIPAFQKNTDYQQKDILSLQEQEGENPQQQNIDIFKTCSCKLNFSLNYSKQIKSSIKVRNIDEQKSYKLRAPFIFGLLHTQFSDQTDLPLFSTLVTEKDY